MTAWWLAAGSLLAGCVPRERPRGDSPSQGSGIEVEDADPEPLREPSAAAPPSSAAELAAAAPPSPAEELPAAAPPAAIEPSAVPADVDPLLVAAFSDNFDRTTLGDAWRATSNAWTLSEGELCGENAKNHPVWLARRLPTNAVIEFDATTYSADGDIKAEFWGDGRSSASGQSYTDATSYLTIFGGWKNRFHVLARLDEHARDRREIKLSPQGADFISKTVVPQQKYQFQVERRDGRNLRWFVDDLEIATYQDPDPLVGSGHEHFGFNDWQVRVCFDNLQVTPLRD